MNEIRKLKLAELNRLDLESFSQKEKIPLVLVLDNLRSALNVGAMFRTADAFAIEKIYLTGICPQPPHKEIHKTAIGADRSVAWEYQESVANVIKELKENSYFVIGIEQTTESSPLSTLALQHDKIAVVMGNEVEGISQEALVLIDQAIELSQYGTKHSLNVSVCAGIVLWKLSQLLR